MWKGVRALVGLRSRLMAAKWLIMRSDARALTVEYTPKVCNACVLTGSLVTE